MQPSPSKQGRKIIYYGIEGSGKTTNLEVIFEQAPDENRSDLISLSSEDAIPLFYDYLSLSLGNILKTDSSFELYTIPGKSAISTLGQASYHRTRQKILEHVEGIVFVVDSQGPLLQQNILALHTLEEYLQTQGVHISTFPLVLQYNKRDAANAVAVEILNEKLNKWNFPFHNTIAIQGVGVFQTLKTMTRMILEKGKKKARFHDPTPSPFRSPSGPPSQNNMQETDTYNVPPEEVQTHYSPNPPSYPYPNATQYPSYYPPQYPQYEQPPYPNPNYPNYPNNNYPPQYPAPYQNQPPYPSYENPYGAETSAFPMPYPPQPSPYETHSGQEPPSQNPYGSETSSFQMPYPPPTSNPYESHSGQPPHSGHSMPSPNQPYGSETSSFQSPYPPPTSNPYAPQPPQSPHPYSPNSPYGSETSSFQSPYPAPPSSPYMQQPPHPNAPYGSETSSFQMPQYNPPPSYQPHSYSSPYPPSYGNFSPPSALPPGSETTNSFPKPNISSSPPKPKFPKKDLFPKSTPDNQFPK